MVDQFRGQGGVEAKLRQIYDSERALELDDRLSSIDAFDHVALLCTDKGYISPYETIYPDPKRPKYVGIFFLTFLNQNHPSPYLVGDAHTLGAKHKAREGPHYRREILA